MRAKLLPRWQPFNARPISPVTTSDKRPWPRGMELFGRITCGAFEALVIIHIFSERFELLGARIFSTTGCDSPSPLNGERIFPNRISRFEPMNHDRSAAILAARWWFAVRAARIAALRF